MSLRLSPVSIAARTRGLRTDRRPAMLFMAAILAFSACGGSGTDSRPPGMSYRIDDTDGRLTILTVNYDRVSAAVFRGERVRGAEGLVPGASTTAMLEGTGMPPAVPGSGFHGASTTAMLEEPDLVNLRNLFSTELIDRYKSESVWGVEPTDPPTATRHTIVNRRRDVLTEGQSAQFAFLGEPKTPESLKLLEKLRSLIERIPAAPANRDR